MGEHEEAGLAIVDEFVQLGIAFLLNIFRAKIGGLQLFAQRSVSRPVRPMAEDAFCLEGRCATFLCQSEMCKREKENKSKKFDLMTLESTNPVGTPDNRSFPNTCAEFTATANWLYASGGILSIFTDAVAAPLLPATSVKARVSDLAPSVVNDT